MFVLSTWQMIWKLKLMISFNKNLRHDEHGFFFGQIFTLWWIILGPCNNPIGNKDYKSWICHHTSMTQKGPVAICMMGDFHLSPIATKHLGRWLPHHPLWLLIFRMSTSCTHNAITSHYANIEKIITAQWASSKTFVVFRYAQLKIYIAACNE
jgi:hypothetical protein